MEHKIVIEYTATKEKAGKLTLEDKNGRKILSKVPVAIPLSYINKTNIESKVGILTNIKNDNNENKDKINDLGITQLTISLSSNTSLFIGQKLSNKNPLLNTDKELFVLKIEDFEKLAYIATTTFDPTNITIEKLAFMLFQDKVNVVENNYNLLLNKNNVNKNSLTTENIVNSVKTTRAKLSSISQMLKPDVLKKESPKSSIVSPKIKKIINKSKLQPVPLPNFKENNNLALKKTDEDLDFFDIYFIENNPTLGLLYKPNSLFAWINYFGQNSSEISKQYVTNNIQNVAGFESVKSSEFKYNEKGYSVQLFANDNKANLLATLEYESRENSYHIKNENGSSTYLEENEQGKWLGKTENDNGNVINYEFAPASNGYVGNWNTYLEDGTIINSGISINEEYNNYTTPNEQYNIQPYLQDYSIYSTPETLPSLPIESVETYTETSNDKEYKEDETFKYTSSTEENIDTTNNTDNTNSTNNNSWSTSEPDPYVDPYTNNLTDPYSDPYNLNPYNINNLDAGNDNGPKF